jgi:hypothetical protein
MSARGKAKKTLENISFMRAVLKAKNAMAFPSPPQCHCSALADILGSPLQLQFFLRMSAILEI